MYQNILFFPQPQLVRRSHAWTTQAAVVSTPTTSSPTSNVCISLQNDTSRRSPVDGAHNTPCGQQVSQKKCKARKCSAGMKNIGIAGWSASVGCSHSRRLLIAWCASAHDPPQVRRFGLPTNAIVPTRRSAPAIESESLRGRLRQTFALGPLRRIASEKPLVGGP